MPDPKSRARVVRLLSDHFRPDDVANLFLYARDRCDGRASVVDIGDFVAHHSERDKGIISDHVRDWAVSAKFHLETFTPNGPRRPHNPNRLPKYFARYLRSSVTIIGPHQIRRNTGLSQVEAQSIIKKFIDKLINSDDGTWAIPSNISPREANVIDFVTSMMVVKPAFTAERLCDDFRATLKSNGLINKEELREFKEKIDLIVQLFAISIMHRSEIILEDKSRITLEAGRGESGLAVSANVPLDLNVERDFFVKTEIFSTSIDPAGNCDAYLLESDKWDVDIELGTNRVLTPLRL